MESRADLYGFITDMTPEEIQLFEKLRKKVESQEELWNLLAVSSCGRNWHFTPATNLYASEKFVLSSLVPHSPRAKIVKALIRSGGVPPNFRAEVWMNVSGASRMKFKKAPSYYKDLCHASGALDTAILRQIDIDVPRSSQHLWFLSEEGQKSLRDVLSAYCVHNPAVGYAQGMNIFCSLLLLVTHSDQETAFWLLVVLIENILIKNAYTPDFAAAPQIQSGFRHLLERNCPRVAHHLHQNLQYDSGICPMRWILTLFADDLPSETALRVWDVLFTEGRDVLPATALSIFQMNEERLLLADNDGEAHQILRQSVSRLCDADALLTLVSKKLPSTEIRCG